MTKREMSELFSLMMLNGNWATAKMFSGDDKALDSTIAFWAKCIEDIDFWTGKQAVMRLVRECTYPPTIADFRKAAEAVTKALNAEIDAAFLELKSCTDRYGSVDAAYRQLPPGRLKTVIATMGGPRAMEVPIKGGTRWNLEGFRATYWRLLRTRTALPEGRKKLKE